MSDAMPNRKSYDMNGHRKAIKVAWKRMQDQYSSQVREWWVLPDGVWPALAEFELGGGRKEERL